MLTADITFQSHRKKIIRLSTEEISLVLRQCYDGKSYDGKSYDGKSYDGKSIK
jgi:hypothetical protein